jgi:hypothetical protein
MKYQPSYQGMLIVPLTAIVCFALGYHVASNHFPTELVQRSVIMLLAFWIAITILEFIVRSINEAFSFALEDDGSKYESRQIIYLVSDGEVVERLKTRRGFFTGVDDPDFRRAVGKLFGRIHLGRNKRDT